MDYRDVLQRKFLKLTTTENYEKYKRQRKKVNNLIKRAEQNYNKNLLDEKHWNKHWSTLKSTFPTKPKSKLISTIFKVNEEEIWSEETIANEFGQFFSSIATTLLQTQHPIEDFVWNKPKNLLTKRTNTTKNYLFPRLHGQKSVNVWKKVEVRKHTESTNFHQIYLKMLPTKFQNQWFSSSTNLYRRVKFQAHGKYQKLHHFINQIQNHTSAITVQYLFYRVFLKY